VRAGAVSGKRIYDKTDFIHGRYLRLKESADYGIEGFSIIQRSFEIKNYQEEPAMAKLIIAPFQ
jgi:hypothetical protein